MMRKGTYNTFALPIGAKLRYTGLLPLDFGNLVIVENNPTSEYIKMRYEDSVKVFDEDRNFVSRAFDLGEMSLIPGENNDTTTTKV